MQNSGFIYINLLPYRKKQKNFKVKQFSLLMSSFVFVALFIIGLYHAFIAARVEIQDSRNAYIETENKELDKQIKSISNLKDEIKLTLEKRKVAETLQINRADGVNIINQVANNLPDGTAIKSIKLEHKSPKSVVTIMGQTTSNNKVSNYMTSLADTEVFENPNLIEIKSVILVPANQSQNIKKQQQEIKANEFTITVDMEQNVSGEFKKFTEELNNKKTKSDNKGGN